MSALADPLLASLQHDYDVTTADAHVIASSLQKSAKRGAALKQTDLAFALTGISSDLTMQGGSQLELDMEDPTWRLLDSGFFDADADGRLDNMDLNYPDGSRFWWRLHQVSPQQDHSLQITFIPRVVSELMDLHGPVKADRAKRTRAEFFKSLLAKVKDPLGPVEFYCKQLDVKQPIGTGSATGTTDTTSSSKAPAKKAAKSVGLGANAATLTCKGQALTSTQAQVVNTILQVGEQLNAPHNALVAACYAAMGESNLDPSASGGVFQTTGNSAAFDGGRDYAGQAKAFFQGTSPFGSPGAIALANQGAPAWVCANQTEVNAVWGTAKYPQMSGDSYGHEWSGGQAEGLKEAEAMVAGGGGAASGTGMVESTQPYYFQINAGEDYWTGMCRLAQEVGWELVVDGNRIYYDADTTLIRQKVAAVIRRDDPTTLDWSFDWVNRQIATNFQIEVACEPFDFHAGEVFQVESFGPASTGSTAKLPGRWLINEIQRNGGDQFSTFTLVQPTAPKKEPAPQVTTSSGAAAGAGGATTIAGSIQDQPTGSAEAAFAAAQYLSSLNLIYSKANRTMVRDVGNQAGKSCYDCSASVSWVLLAAGFPLPGNVQWGGWAPVSGDFFAGGAGGALLAGPGQYMTVYANGEHIFIRIHPNGLADMQGNTVNPGGHGFGFFPWTKPGCGGWGGPSPGVGAPAFWQVHYAGT